MDVAARNEASGTSCKNISICRQIRLRADARTRTGDPFITSEVLYQLSYVGVCRDFLDSPRSRRDLVQRGCSKIKVGRRSGQA
jgi:hypothetical protein